MEEFVRKLVATADLSILSKKMVRQHYLTFSGKTSLTTAEKDGINNFIDQLLQDISEGKEISPTRPEIKGRVKDVQKENKDTVLCNSQPTTPKGLRKRKRSLSKSPGVKNSPKRYQKSTKKRFSLDEVVDILNKSDENGNMSDNSDENGKTSDKSDDDQLNDSREENFSSSVSSPSKTGNRERYSADVDSSDNDSDDSFSSGHDSESAGRSSCKQKNRKSKADEENKSEFVTLSSSKVKPLKSRKLNRETNNKKTISSKENYTFNSKENAKNEHLRRVKTLIDTDSDNDSDTMEKTSVSKFQVEDSGLDVQSDSEAGSSFSDSPVKTLSRKRQVVSCIESTDSEDDEDSNSAERWHASRQFANHDSLRRAEQEQVSSDNENVEEEKQVKQRKQKSVKRSSTDTDSDEDVPLSRYSKEGEKKSVKNVEKKDDKKTSENKKNQKTSKEKKSQNKTVEYLKKICKASGIFLRGKKSLKDCTTDKEMIDRMKEILKEAGMDGKPTLEKAEELRLMTEAAELDTGNILSDKSVVGKRKVQSLFSRREASPSPVKKSAFTGFRHLKDLVDSDASSDD